MDIIEAIKTDREQGTRMLIAAYGDRLFKTAVGFCEDESAAQDIVMRTFVKVVDGIDGFNRESSLGWPSAYEEDFNRRAGECLPTGAVAPDLTLSFLSTPSAGGTCAGAVDFMVASIESADASAVRYDHATGLMFFVR